MSRNKRKSSSQQTSINPKIYQWLAIRFIRLLILTGIFFVFSPIDTKDKEWLQISVEIIPRLGLIYFIIWTIKLLFKRVDKQNDLENKRYCFDRGMNLIKEIPEKGIESLFDNVLDDTNATKYRDDEVKENLESERTSVVSILERLLRFIKNPSPPP